MSAISETIDDLRGGGRGWTLLVVAAGWLLINGFRVVLPALLPQIKADFQIDNASAGFALTVLWMLYAGLQFPSGIVADRVGERSLLLVGGVVAALSLGAFYLSPFFLVFLLACALFGFGAGLFGTPRDMLLSRTFADTDSTAYGVTFAFGSLGAAGLPYLATAITTRFGWRVGVVWLLPIFLVVSVGLWLTVPARRPEADDGRLRAGETVRRTIEALTDRTVLLASIVVLLFLFTYQALLSFLPTYLVEVKGLEQQFAAALFGLFFVFSAIVQPAAGIIADRFGDRMPVLVMIVLGTVTLGVLPFVEGVVALAILVPFLGIRIGIGPLTNAFIVRNLPSAIRGMGWGFLRTVFFAVGATGSSIVGVFGDAGLFDAAFLLLAALTGISAIFWIRVFHE